MIVFCLNCGVSFNKNNSAVKRSTAHFCTRGCAGTYNGKRRVGPYGGDEIVRLKQLARDLRQGGKSYREISDAIKISASTIKYWVFDVSCPSSPLDNLRRVARINTQKINVTTKVALKGRIVKLRGYSCEDCDIGNWLGKALSLELHHIDGNNRNNDFKNLRLLCPNCHSQTPNFRNKKRE